MFNTAFYKYAVQAYLITINAGPILLLYNMRQEKFREKENWNMQLFTYKFCT